MNIITETPMLTPTYVDTALTVSEACELLACSPGYLRKLLRDGSLKGFKMGSDWRVFLSVLMAFATNAVTR